MKTRNLSSAALCAALLTSSTIASIAISALGALSGTAWAQEGSPSLVAGVPLPRGASRITSGGLPSGMGRMMVAGAKEFDLPEPENKSTNAEVYFWTGANYKEGRSRFLITQLQSALTDAGYTVTIKDPTVDNVPNIFDDDAYGTGALDLVPFDGRPAFFHATNPDKRQTLVGVWIDQPSKKRLVLAMGAVGFAGVPKISKAPEISDPNVWLVKDFKDASRGMPEPPVPVFAKMAPKPRTVRGIAKDGNGKPIAGAHFVAQSSAAGGFRTSFEGRTDAQGYYEIPLPVGICQIVNADCWINYGGQRMLLPLHPADGERDEFDSRPGHVENFVLRTSGAADDNGHSYGAPLRVLTYNTIEKSIIEVTLKPTAPLADGSRGKTLVFRWKAPAAGLGGETIIGGIPLGQYKLTAKLYDGDDALPLRTKKTFNDDGDDPVFGPSVPVIFQAENVGRANLGQTGIKRFEVTLEP